MLSLWLKLLYITEEINCCFVINMNFFHLFTIRQNAITPSGCSEEEQVIICDSNGNDKLIKRNVGLSYSLQTLGGRINGVYVYSLPEEEQL